jgi:hypothetical protein
MNPHDIRIQADMAARLREALAAHGDEELTLDMIEGETRLFDMLDQLAEARAEDLAMVEAIKLREADLSERRKRIAARADAHRDLVHKALEISGQRKVERPLYTASIAAGRASVVITDELALPDYYIRTKREPDKTKIGDALKGGETVPGACMSNAPPSCRIQMK